MIATTSRSRRSRLYAVFRSPPVVPICHAARLRRAFFPSTSVCWSPIDALGMSSPLTSSARVQCAECLRILRINTRRASTSTFARRGGGDRSEGPSAAGASWQARPQRPELPRRPPDHLRQVRPATAHQRPLQPARPFSKPEASKTKFKERDSEKKLDEPLNVNFSQGSALAAFLSKAPPPSSKSQAVSSPRSPSKPARPAVMKPPTMSQRQAAQAVRRPRPPTKNNARQPMRKVEISQMTSVNNLSRILGLKLRKLASIHSSMCIDVCIFRATAAFDAKNGNVRHTAR